MSTNRKSLPDQFVTTDDAGIPNGVLDVATVQRMSTRLAFELVDACDSDAELSRIICQFVEKLGATTYRYAAAVSLKFLVATVLRDTLEVVERAAPELQVRQHLRDAAVRGRENFPLD